MFTVLTFDEGVGFTVLTFDEDVNVYSTYT